jgi:hypothetical protein
LLECKDAKMMQVKMDELVHFFKKALND